jgi:DNA-binding NarL/FixJ family response regulator
MRVLLVDDHVLFSQSLKFLLAELEPNLDCISARTLTQALAESGPFDLVLLDYKLPDAHGYEGLERIQQIHDQAVVVVLSGVSNSEVIHELVHRGAAGFVSKASDIDTLLLALRTILNGGVYLSPDVYSLPASDNEETAFLLNHLTARQLDVLVLLHNGNSNRQIAEQLRLTENTVKTHLKELFRLLQVSNRTQAVLKASALGLPNK